MATVIDAFLVTLGLDGRGFTAGAKKVDQEQRQLSDAQRRRDQEEKRSAAERDRATRNSVDGYRKVRNEVLALATIFTAGVGIKDFISDTINGAVTLGYLSQNLGMSTERIKAFQLASERARGTQGGLTAQLKESVDAIAELSTGGGPNAGMQAFFRWGGSSADLKDGNTYLMARSKIIHDLAQVDPGRASLIAKQMGISEDQFNFIKQGPDAIQALIAAQEKHAAVSAKDAEAALLLRNKVLDLRDALQQTATRVILQLAPALERLFARLERGAEWIAKHQDDIAQWVDSSITAIRDFIRWADSAAEAVGGWKNVLIGLAAIKFIGMIAGAVELAAALLGVAGAVTAIGTAASGALPLLARVAAPMLPVAAAGAAGYAAGTYAYKNWIPDDVKDGIGEFISRTLASFGNQQAAENIRVNTGRDDYPAVRAQQQQRPSTVSVQAPTVIDRTREPKLPPLSEMAPTIFERSPQPSAALSPQQPLPVIVPGPTQVIGAPVPKLPPIGAPAVTVRPDITVVQQQRQERLQAAAAPTPQPKEAARQLAALEVKHELPRGVLDGIWKAESARGVHMVSPAGAEGHFGFMPKTATEYGLKNPYDFGEAADAAARKFKVLLATYGGDMTKAAAAYNWGEGNLDRKGITHAPKETRDYVVKIADSVQRAAAPENRAPQPIQQPGNTRTSETNIKNLNIHTQAKDAEGIARTIQPAIERYDYSNSANTGMTQ